MVALETHSYLITFSILASLSFCLKQCIAIDTITPTQILKYDKTLVSSGNIFELGFFSPGDSKNTYLGIWYKATPDVVVWVANRDNPLADSHVQLSFNDKGNLLLLNQTGKLVWSSNTSTVARNPVAQVLDSGNLVVRSSINSSTYLWQSFDYPTDTLLADMKLGWDLNTGLDRHLLSWTSPDDPSTGDSAFSMNITGLPQLTISKGSTMMFSSGLWNGIWFSGLPLSRTKIFDIFVVSNENESYYMFKPGPQGLNVISRMVINETTGLISRYVMENTSNKWDLMYSLPYEECQNYGYCGANGLCRTTQNPVCGCLEGFQPSSLDEWAVLNWSNGCKRKAPLDCQKGEDFVKIEGVKLPDFTHFWLNKTMKSLEECKEQCLKNCSCTAYANPDVRSGGSGCLMWFVDLVDTRELRVDGTEQVFYVRLAASEIRKIQDAKRKRKLKTILVAPIIVSVLCILGLIICCIVHKRRRKLIVFKRKNEDIELPLFNLTTLVNATNNFSPTCMIGAGGFGPVYKGILSTGQEIAVKRLSHYSGQGLREFKNEVKLIAKLQHRNLVSLLGCCMEKEERILIYEFMQNKSLDNFIFDNKRGAILGWKQHFDIIMGIARGLLYLHRDSKLQIIHRDLKASNILLDKNMNPKISDFGLARIFEDGENEVKTRRVVGTYGYMSPEYAIDGKFSTKSDIFSFGVLLLEVVCGKKNRKFSHSDHHHNLLGHAWMLWNDGAALDLIDECFNDSCIEHQVLRCIHVGLLCVQKFPQNRPAMSLVVFMLENEEAMLPQSKQPGFFMERSSNDESSVLINETRQSKNSMTITILNAR